jgi:hypothetical protein
MPSTSSGGSVAVSKPTKWRFNSGTGFLQKQDPNSTIWSDFTIKGLNYSPTPPGWTPEYPHKGYGVTSNIPQIKKFASMLKNINGNTLRIYVNFYGGAFPTSGPGNVYDRTDPLVLLKFLDECYAKRIYVLVDIYVNFAYNSTTKDRYHYRTLVADNMMQAVTVTKDHPAVMGYIFGNETNLGYSLVNETLTAWNKLANDVAKEVTTIDNGNHLFGPCNVASPAIIAAENAGELNACNVHFFNAYPNPQWNENSATPNSGQFSSWRNQITNGKKFIITETGYSSYNEITQSQDEANHALYTGQLWDNFIKPPAANNGGGQDVCGGICFFAGVDELWKGGPYIGQTPVQFNQALIANDGSYTNCAGLDESWNVTNPAAPVRKTVIPTIGYINPIGDGRFHEQHFGWWKFGDGNLTANPLIPKQVVATMTNKWL